MEAAQPQQSTSLMSSRDLILSIVYDEINSIVQMAITNKDMTTDPPTVENLYVPFPLQISAEAAATESFVPAPDAFSSEIAPTCADPIQKSRLVVVFPEVFDIDLELIFFHPRETKAAKIARVQETRERRSGNSALEDDSSLDYDHASPVELKLENLAAINRTLEGLDKDTQSSVTGTRVDLEVFKDRILSEVSRIQSYFLSFSKGFCSTQKWSS